MTQQQEGSSGRWWAVASSDDLGPMKLLPVMIDGDQFVVFRDAQGVARALIDQCAHRRAPLSDGKVTASGWVECPYHGWRYDGQTGACMAIPNLSKDERVPKAYRVAAFDVLERAGFLFLRLGAPAGAGDVDGLPLSSAGGVFGSHLISYPRALLIDLLLDSPSAVLEIPGVAVIGDHWYGEPVIRAGVLVLDFAAQWMNQLSDAAVADYPLVVRICLDLARESVVVELRSDEDDLLASSWLEASPVKPSLTAVFWSAAIIPGATREVSIGVKREIDPRLVRVSLGNASKMRRLGMIPVQTGTAENAGARATA